MSSSNYVPSNVLACTPAICCVPEQKGVTGTAQHCTLQLKGGTAITSRFFKTNKENMRFKPTMSDSCQEPHRYLHLGN